jgi:para-aminobenzoate synthetase/4-amino-4-deoxychorismate lyase
MVCELDGPTPILKRSKTLLTKKDTPDASANEPEARFWQDGAPFVLLDDARPGGFARLLRRPSAVVETRDPAGIAACLERLRGESRHAAGFLAYEAGYGLERKLAPLAAPAAADAPPLLWFGLFEAEEAFDAAALPDPRSAWAGRPKPMIARADYEAAIGRIADHIAEGDLYQANFTFQAEIASAGHPVALYSALRARAGAGWGGIVHTGAHWLLCFSPESFFTLEEGKLTARPMKGTAPLSTSPEALRDDEKQRAENLMIVDLLRNDLARVARPGTVKVPELFAVETYPTLRQMTSTVTATLAGGLGPVDVLQTIFPCGSITGAPKIRAMEIIAGLEAGPRGVYTGAIGAIAPDGGARFNVAIRTLVLRDGENGARIGLGSGIVADSVAGEEWAECLAKGAFVESGDFDLIETMRFEPRDGIAELERHLARMKASAEAFDFLFDRHHARNELQAASFALGAPRRLRLRLSRSGAIAIEARAPPAAPSGPVAVAAAPMPVLADDFRLRHKTSDRGFYDEARVPGAFETIFVDPEGFVTEGSFTSLFVRKSGTLLTPPLSRGLLPGTLRERLIEEGRAREAELRLEDLAGTFYIGNAVRGLIAASLL